MNIKDYAEKKTELCVANDSISDDLYKQYGVNRGLRDINGKGRAHGAYRHIQNGFF